MMKMKKMMMEEQDWRFKDLILKQHDYHYDYNQPKGPHGHAK